MPHVPGTRLRFAAHAVSLAGLTGCLLLAGGPAAARPTPPAPAAGVPASTGVRAAPAADPGLSARAAAVSQRLVAGTRRLAGTQAALAGALADLRRAEQDQATARIGVAAARAGLNDLAAAAYREAAGSGLSLLLRLGEQDPQDALTAAGYLDRANSYRARVLGQVRAAEAAAARAAAAAERARRLAVATQQSVLTQVATLQAAAVAADASLTGPRAASRAGGRRPLPPTDLASLAAAGYPNGLIPASALCSAGIKAEVLRCDAAAAFRRLAPAFARAFGRPICVTDSYRSYPEQVAVYRQRPSLAAVPGTSNHGWGLAMDLCGGLSTAGSPEDRWMHANAGRFGWVHPAWAEPGGSRPEPWHWEFVGLAAATLQPAGR